MNKATKGAIAAGAAGILLLGGAGTFALWEDSNAIDPASISTGELTLGVAAGEWKDVTVPLTPVPIDDIAAFDIVPGDTITYTADVTVKAEGNNLQGELKIDEDSTFAATVGGTAVSYAHASVISNADDVDGLIVDGDGRITFSTAATYVITVTVTVVFDNVNELMGQNTAIDLSTIELKLEQA